MASGISRIAAWIPVCFALLFGLGFLACGALGVYASFAGRDPPSMSLGASTLGAILLGSVGLMILNLALGLALRRLRYTCHAMPVDEPWRIRSDWAVGEVWPATTSTLGALVVAVVTAYWLVATLPLLSGLPEILRSETSEWKWLLLAFPLLDLAMVLALVNSITRVFKFGDSVFVLTSLPGIVGRELAGTVRIPRRVQPETGFRLKLTCTEQYDCNGTMKQHDAWEDERLVLKPVRGDSEHETNVPVRFKIPADCPETSRPESKYSTEWKLHVSARLPGVDYDALFTVPIFKSARVQAGLPIRESGVEKAEADDENAKLPAAMLLREAGIIKESPSGKRVRLIFTARRNWLVAAFLTVVFAPFVGFIALMVKFEAPILLTAAFGIVALWCAKGLLKLWFTRSEVEASPEGLRVSRGVFGIGKGRFVPIDQIDDFSVGEGTWRCPGVVLHDGEEIILATGISSALVEQAIFDELDAALGRLQK